MTLNKQQQKQPQMPTNIEENRKFTTVKGDDSRHVVIIVGIEWC